ncbi:MAG: ATP-dependent Clp protease ATP-binding subunit [bacterium]
MLKPEQKIELIDYISCNQCQCSGIFAHRTCTHCDGIGLVRKLEGGLVYWRQNLDQGEVDVRHLANGLNWLIDLFLLFLMVTGAIDFLQKLYAFNLIKESVIPSLGFWPLMAILAGMFAYYRLSYRQNQSAVIPLVNKYGPINTNWLNDDIDDWLQFPKVSRRHKLELSRYLHSSTQSVLDKAYEMAHHGHYARVRPVHLLLALLGHKKVVAILVRLEVPVKKIAEQAVAALGPLGKGPQTVVGFSLHKAVLEAYAIAYAKKKKQVKVEDLLVAIAQEDEVIQNIFLDVGIDLLRLKNTVRWIEYQEILSRNWHKYRALARFKPKNNMDRAMTAIATPLLDTFSRDLTMLAKFGYFMPCVGREAEIDKILRTLEGGAARNVLLIGESGVGKSDIINAIAQKMVTEDVSEILRDKRLVLLNAESLIGGVRPEEAQARLLKVLNEIARSGNIVLVLENINRLIGISAGSEQSLDLLQIFSKVLLNNRVLCIATSTPKDYSENLEGKGTLRGIFEPVNISEPNENDAILVAETKVGMIEAKNQVFFSYKSVEQAVKLSARLIHDRFLPAKALAVLEDAAMLAKKERGRNTLVKLEDVAKVIEQMTGVPTQAITASESEKLLNLEEKIHRRLIGQDDAVNMAAGALRRARTQLETGKRPIASLLFLGPTGVGKTELAKTIAEVYFGAENSMIRLDMSEYQGEMAVARLIGYGQGKTEIGGQLTEAVRHKPFSLVLLDEIEKTNPNILNLFLQVMEDGRLTDNSGRLIDFSNTIIIATSNAGTDFVQEQLKLGTEIGLIKQQLMDTHLKSYFKPEFLNRFDGIIVFKPLVDIEARKIAQLMIKKIADNLLEKGIGLELTSAMLEELVLAGFNPLYGARSLRRVVQDRISDVLANYILSNRLKRRDVVIFDKNGQVSVRRPDGYKV